MPLYLKKNGVSLALYSDINISSCMYMAHICTIFMQIALFIYSFEILKTNLN